jgi:hypothetical protein
MRRAIGFDCQVVRSHDFKLIGRRGIDLSPLGMLVVGDMPALTGETVIVAFRLPRIRIWFDVQGAVARVVHGRRPRDRAPLCFGLEFDGLAPNVVRYLRSELHGLAPPLPMREPRIDYAATVHLAALS